MTRFGWCTAPTGARPKHAHCPGKVAGMNCGCWCHEEEK